MAISITENTTMYVNTHKTYNVQFFNENILTTVTSNGAVVSDWINGVKYRYPMGSIIVGLDVEWNPFFTAGNRNPVATLQLCVDRSCLIYQIIHTDWIPQALADFFSHELSSTTFVGVGIKSDVDKLQNDYRLGYGAYYVELAPAAAERRGRKELKEKGLAGLASIILGKEVDKPNAVRMSRWDNRWLTAEQVKYACVDAYMASEIARAI